MSTVRLLGWRTVLGPITGNFSRAEPTVSQDAFGVGRAFNDLYGERSECERWSMERVGRQRLWIMTTIHHAKYEAGQRVASRTGASEFAVMRAPHAARRYAVDVEVVGDHRCRGTQARRRNRPTTRHQCCQRLDLASDRCGVGVSGLWWVSDILRGMSLEGLEAQVGQVLGMLGACMGPRRRAVDGRVRGR